MELQSKTVILCSLVIRNKFSNKPFILNFNVTMYKTKFKFNLLCSNAKIQNNNNMLLAINNRFPLDTYLIRILNLFVTMVSLINT